MSTATLALRFREWKSSMQGIVASSLANAKCEPASQSAQKWCAGLLISPISFSRQLCDMQISLQQRGEKQSQ